MNIFMSLLFEIQIGLDISQDLEATASNNHTQNPVQEHALYYEDAFLSLYSKITSPKVIIAKLRQSFTEISIIITENPAAHPNQNQ